MLFAVFASIGEIGLTLAILQHGICLLVKAKKTENTEGKAVKEVFSFSSRVLFKNYVKVPHFPRYTVPFFSIPFQTETQSPAGSRWDS